MCFLLVKFRFTSNHLLEKTKNVTDVTFAVSYFFSRFAPNNVIASLAF